MRNNAISTAYYNNINATEPIKKTMKALTGILTALLGLAGIATFVEKRL